MPTPEQVNDFNGQYAGIINLILPLLYHPACPFSYSHNPVDPHPKTPLEENGRQADIDTPLVPLVRQLWRAGCHTVGSCHDIGEGFAYIQFISAEHGANTFLNVLRFRIQGPFAPLSPAIQGAMNDDRVSPEELRFYQERFTNLVGRDLTPASLVTAGSLGCPQSSAQTATPRRAR
jgi:hypothetical protein